MHCAATHDRYLNVVLKGGVARDEALVREFGGGSTPSDENVPSLSTIREAFGAAVVPKIVGFVDDDPLHRNTRVGGYSVLGGYADLIRIVERGEIECVVLNTHLVDVERLQKLEQICEGNEVQLLRIHVDLKPVKPISAAS